MLLEMSQATQKRRRGMVLTAVGLQRLRQAIHKFEQDENQGDRATLEDLSDRTQLDPKTLSKLLEAKTGLDKRTLERCFLAFQLQLQTDDYVAAHASAAIAQTDWGEAVDVTYFYGRQTELQCLESWLLQEHCRVVTLLGLGGVGKTTLSVQLAQQVQAQFEVVIWRSLRNAPTFHQILSEWLQTLSLENFSPESNGTIPWNQLLTLLRQRRCLLILDNWETLLQSSAGTQREMVGRYREGFESYGELIRQLAETPHHSCLILTSREKPAEMAALEGEHLPVRTLQLQGLSQPEAAEILQVKGLKASQEEYDRLIALYQGNPLALKIVATAIQDIFAGQVNPFLAQGTTIFNGIRLLLDQQFQRLSALEQSVMFWLAIEREPLTLPELQSNFVAPVNPARLLEALESLSRRCLIERTRSAQFTLQPVVMEYVSDQLVQQSCKELLSSQAAHTLRNYLLLKAQAKDYVRDAQSRLFLQPLVHELLEALGTAEAIVNHLNPVLVQLQKKSPPEPGYSAGNIVNLLCYLQVDLTGYDLSNLVIRQAYLQETRLHQVNFSGSDLTDSRFANLFPCTMALCFSQDEQLLVSGHLDPRICLWDVYRGQQSLVLLGHRKIVWTIAFSPDDQVIASGSQDETIRLWQRQTGQCLATLTGHRGAVQDVVFVNHERLISAGADQMIRVWDLKQQSCCQLWQAHSKNIWTIALSPDRQILASGSDDHQIKLWEIATGTCLQTLVGHQNALRSVSFSPSGRYLASCGLDRTVRIWEVKTGECLTILPEATHIVFTVIFIDDHTLIASSLDGVIRYWDWPQAHCLRVLRGHTNSVYALALNASKTLLASGSDDQTLRLWDCHRGVCLRMLQGRINWFSSVAFHPTQNRIASGSEDRLVRLWDLEQDSCQVLSGHRDRIWSVAFSPDGQLLASTSVDQTIRLWDVEQTRCLAVLEGHQSVVSAIVFTADSQQLISGSHDGTIKVWDLATRQVIKTFPEQVVQSVALTPDNQQLAIGTYDERVRLWNLAEVRCDRQFQGHHHWVWYVAISADGQWLATGSTDHSLRLWHLQTETTFLLEGHQDWVMGVAFSPNSQILASASGDGTIRLWEVSTGLALATLTGHQTWVMGIAFSPDGKRLVSAGADETLRIWDTTQYLCLKTLRVERLYEGMNLKKTTGLTEAQRAILAVLGAKLF